MAGVVRLLSSSSAGAAVSEMPLIGFGTSKITDFDTILSSLDAALECGYRLIDTAQLYENEQHIGRALQTLMPKYELTRTDLFITSKLLHSNMSKEKIRPSVEQTLKDLQTDYVDLFLIHYPKPSWADNKDPNNKVARKECWLEMEKLHGEGKLGSIGVSNYETAHLSEMASYQSVRPAVNQCEFHPHYCRRDLFDRSKEAGIHFQAFTSLGHFNSALVSEPLLVQLAQKYQVPVSRILLAWPMMQGISVLPRSTNPDRIRDNYEAVHAKLTQEEVEKIWGLHKGVNYSLCKPWDVQ